MHNWKGSSIIDVWSQEVPQYLYGKKFKLLTNHKSLTAILGPKKIFPSQLLPDCKGGHFSYQPTIMKSPLNQHKITAMLIGCPDFPYQIRIPKLNMKQLLFSIWPEFKHYPLQFNKYILLPDETRSKILTYDKTGWARQCSRRTQDIPDRMKQELKMVV